MHTRTLTLTLPAETVDELDARIAAGLARDLESGIVDAVERTRENGLAAWIESEGAARYDRIMAGERTLSVDEVKAGIERRRQARLSNTA